MEELAPLILIGAIGAAIALVVIGLRQQSQRRLNAVYSQISGLYLGRYQPAGLFGQPVIRFYYKGAAVLITIDRPQNQAQPGTLFEIAWPHPEMSCDVTPRTFFGSVAGLLGRRISLDSARFDKLFVVRGSDASAVRTLLSPGVQNIIEQLYQLHDAPHLSVTFNSGILQIRKRGAIRDYSPLRQFVSSSLELFDQAMLTSLAGIEIVGERMAASVGEAKCQICCESIAHDVVYCRSCKTPHHYECWQYTGMCSTFGCGERRYMTGRSARRALRAPGSPNG